MWQRTTTLYTNWQSLCVQMQNYTEVCAPQSVCQTRQFSPALLDTHPHHRRASETTESETESNWNCPSFRLQILYQHTHTHAHLMALCPGLPARVSRYQKSKTYVYFTEVRDRLGTKYNTCKSSTNYNKFILLHIDIYYYHWKRFTMSHFGNVRINATNVKTVILLCCIKYKFQTKKTERFIIHRYTPRTVNINFFMTIQLGNCTGLWSSTCKTSVIQ